MKEEGKGTFIIYAWQMLEGLKENYLELWTNKYGRSRTIYLRPIRWGFKRRKIKHSNRSKIHSSTLMQMARLFNSIPPCLRNMSGKTTDTFKHHLDNWLCRVPDTPRIDNYSSIVAADTNSIIDQSRFEEKNDNQAVAQTTVRQLSSYLGR